MEDQQQPVSQVWDKWDSIHPQVKRCLLEKKFFTATEIQASVLSVYRFYNDFVLASQTGSGKTLAFGIPIISEILHTKQGNIISDEQGKTKPKRNQLRALILAPTRELVFQIEDHLKQINKHTKEHILIGSLVGGMSKQKQTRILGYRPDILIATPGRLWDMIENEQHPHLQQLHQLDYIVMDEADRMVEMGHFKELDKIMEKVFAFSNELPDNIKKEDLQKIGGVIKPVLLMKKTKSKQNPLFISENLDQMVEGELYELQEDKLYHVQQNDDYSDQDQPKESENQEEPLQEGEEEVEKKFKDEDYDEQDLKKYRKINENEDEDDQEDYQEADNEDGDEEDDDDEIEDEDDGQEQEIGSQEFDQEEEEEEEEENLWDEQPAQKASNQKSLKTQSSKKLQREEIEEQEDEDLDGENGEEDQQEEIIEDDEFLEAEELTENQLVGENGKIRKKSTKKKVFLVSATLTHQFAGNKHKIGGQKDKKDKKDKKNKKGGQEVSKEEKLLPKLEALYKRIKFSGKVKTIDLTHQFVIPKKLIELKTFTIEEDQLLYLYHYLKSHADETFIVFCNSISLVKKIADTLALLEFKAVSLHSEMQQRQRLKKLDQFKQKQVLILVSTDVAARGLDIPLVQNIVHYQIPFDIDTYIHRSGRTARIGEIGTSYALVGPKDMDRYKKLCAQLGKDQGITEYKITIQEQMEIKDLILQAQEYERSQNDVDKNEKQKAWLQRMISNQQVDFEEYDLKKDLQNIEDELKKKRFVSSNYKKEFKSASNTDNKFKDRRRNAIFLDPTQIHQFSDQMQKIKDDIKQQKLNEQNRSKFQQHTPEQEDQGEGDNQWNKKKHNNFNQNKNMLHKRRRDQF